MTGLSADPISEKPAKADYPKIYADVIDTLQVKIDQLLCDLEAEEYDRYEDEESMQHAIKAHEAAIKVLEKAQFEYAMSWGYVDP